MPDKLIRAALYGRYSYGGQREESIEGQFRDCRRYAEAHGITVVAEYADRGMTGTNDKRPEFQRMIRDSSRGLFDVLIVWKTDRFARSRYDSAIYKSKLKRGGVRVIYAKEDIPEGPEGIMLESMLEGMAEYYSANLAQNVKRGNYDSALKRQTLGQVVYGLRKAADKTFELDPATAPVVRRIFEEYAAGRPAKDIYTDLNNEGYRTVRGNKFSKNSLRRILQNEKYMGVYTYADIYDEHGIPPIVTRELFEAAQKMLALHHHSPALKIIDGGFLLTGKLYCGECGRAMTGDSGTGKSGRVFRYYTCMGRREKLCAKSRVAKDVVEDAVVEELARIVNSDEMIAEIADRYLVWQSEQQRDDGVLRGLEEQLKKTEQAIRNNMALVDSGIITDSIRTHLVELEGQRISLETGIAKEKLNAAAPDIDRDTIVWFLTRFRDGDIKSHTYRVTLVETFLQAAYLYDDGRLLLHYNFSGTKNKSSVQLATTAITSGTPLCSDLAHSGVPKVAKQNTIYFYFGNYIGARLLKKE